MTNVEQLAYRDRVQMLALSMLQNATVQADTNMNGVVLTIVYEG